MVFFNAMYIDFHSHDSLNTHSASPSLKNIQKTLDRIIQRVYNYQYILNIQNILIILIKEVTVMAKKNRDEPCCTSADMAMSCCKVESVINVDDRGQMVLPKEIRDKAGINAGDKLAVISWEKDGEVCCISLIKVESLAGMVKDMLGPVIKEIL